MAGAFALTGTAGAAFRPAVPAAVSAAGAGNLAFGGGVADGSAGTAGVEPAPTVYVVFWGSQWNNNDPSGEAAILRNFYSGVGGSTWMNTVTQYCQGVPSGTVSCNGAGTPAGNPTGILAGTWYDNAKAAPRTPKQVQGRLAAEAVRAAAHFGNTTATANASVHYVIATASGDNPSGFGTSYCANRGWTSSSYGDISYVNLPYVTDAGATCGADFNGLGADAGITIVAGMMLAAAITDPFRSGGWEDSAGGDIGSKCAWSAATQDITLPTGTFAVSPLWSNAASNGAGGCVVTYP
jgi:serine protease